MSSIKRKKPRRNHLFKTLGQVLCVLAALSSPRLFATDAGDVLVHAVEGWNNNLQVFQTRAELGYAFWNDFSMGGVFEFNNDFYTPALGLTWHLEPFEVLGDVGPLFWHQNGDRQTTIQFSIHANYMFQITTHFQFLLSAGVNLPDAFFRGVPIGAGFRYWL